MVAPFRLDRCAGRRRAAPAPADHHADRSAPTPAPRAGASAAALGRRRSCCASSSCSRPPGIVAAVRLQRARPRARRSRPVLARSVDVPPEPGHAAVADGRPGGRRRALRRRRPPARPAEKPVPVASLTKLMTAYVVLHDHPLAPGPDRARHHGHARPTSPTTTTDTDQRRLQRPGRARARSHRAPAARTACSCTRRTTTPTCWPRWDAGSVAGLRGQDEHGRGRSWA